MIGAAVLPALSMAIPPASPTLPATHAYALISTVAIRPTKGVK